MDDHILTYIRELETRLLAAEVELPAMREDIKEQLEKEG